VSTCEFIREAALKELGFASTTAALLKSHCAADRPISIARARRGGSHGAAFNFENQGTKWGTSPLEVFVFFLTLVANSGELAASDTGITLTFAARPPQTPSNDHDRSWTGHAYLVIGVKTSTGIKEDYINLLYLIFIIFNKILLSIFRRLTTRITSVVIRSCRIGGRNGFAR
jgi:hypothetical protein